MSRYSGGVNLLNSKRSGGMPIKRHGDVTLTDPHAGLYNTWYNNANPLFSDTVDDQLIALSQHNQLHPIFDLIGFENSDAYQRDQGYITYQAPSGSGAGTPTRGRNTDPCDDGDGVEFGTAIARITGWTEFKRSSDSFDMRQLGMKLHEKFPSFFVDGTPIEDDYDWAMQNISAVQVQDYHEWLIDGDASLANETDGLYNLLDGTAIDAENATNIPALANYVVDWDSNPINASALGAVVTGQRAFAIPIGTTFWTIMREWVTSNLIPRINWSSLPSFNTPLEIHFLSAPAFLNCLIESYICEVVCQADPTTATIRQIQDLDRAKEARTELLNQIAMGAVVFTIAGARLIFHPYAWGTNLDNGDGTYNLVGFVPFVGNRKTFGFDVRDMNGINNYVGSASDNYLTSDNGRVLSYETLEHTCIKYHMLMDMRLGIHNKWLGIRFDNIACGNLFGYSASPMGALFMGTGAVDAVEYQTASAVAVQ